MLRKSGVIVFLLILMVLHAVIFMVFYPPIAGVDDEVGFINQSRIWLLGGISSEGVGLPFPPYDFVEVDGRHVAARHPGRSLLALPFLALGGGRFIFLSGLLLHLAMTATGAWLLVKLGRSPLWAALLLFHPTLAVYSRTIMGDGAAGTGLLIAACAVASGRPIAAGIWVGVAATMRFHAMLALPIIAGAFVWQKEKGSLMRCDWVAATRCLASGGATGCLLVAYNLIVYHAPNEPFTLRRGWFSTEFVESNLSFYEISLMVVWPGMLLTPFFDRSILRWTTRGLIVVFLFPLMFYYFHDHAPGWFETLILGQRLIQVALPVWIISYVGVVDELFATRLRGWLGPGRWVSLAGIVCIGLLASDLAASSLHQRHLHELAYARDALAAQIPVGATIVYHGAVFKLTLSPEGVQLYRTLHLEDDDRPTNDPTICIDDLDRVTSPWFLVVLKRLPGQSLSSTCLDVVRRYKLEPAPVHSSFLAVYRPSKFRSSSRVDAMSFP